MINNNGLEEHRVGVNVTLLQWEETVQVTSRKVGLEGGSIGSVMCEVTSAMCGAAVTSAWLDLAAK